MPAVPSVEIQSEQTAGVPALSSAYIPLGKAN